MRKPLIAGNFKMFKTVAEVRAYARGLRHSLDGLSGREAAVCPPFTALAAAAEEFKGGPVAWGAQNLHWEKQGAFTGEISAGMLSELGCRYAIVGHSERRQYFGETDATVNKRMNAALGAGITPIVCIGETLQERETGQTIVVLERQLQGGLQGLAPSASIVIAYEPVWAIGTGKTATPAQAQEAHAFTRGWLAKNLGQAFAASTRLLYGGSVKPDNMSSLMAQPDIDGGLVGGACLEVESFTRIVRY